MLKIGHFFTCISTDGRTDDAFSTVLELSELSKVIGALEAESGTPFNASKSLKDGCSNLTDDGKDDDADPRPSGTVPISFPVVGSQGSNKGLPGDVACSPPSNGSFSAGASLGGVTTSTAQDQASRSMVKLYNDLALRLMDEQQDYDQALVMLRKAESHLDNDSAWDSIHSAQDDKDFDDKVPLEVGPCAFPFSSYESFGYLHAKPVAAYPCLYKHCCSIAIPRTSFFNNPETYERNNSSTCFARCLFCMMSLNHHGGKLCFVCFSKKFFSELGT